MRLTGIGPLVRLGRAPSTRTSSTHGKGRDSPTRISQTRGGADGIVSGTWVLTGEEKERPVEPKRRLGAVEAAARFDRLWFDSAGGEPPPLRNPRADDILPNGDRVVSLGINWYINRWVKLQFHTIREQVQDPERSPVVAEPGLLELRLPVSGRHLGRRMRRPAQESVMHPRRNVLLVALAAVMFVAASSPAHTQIALDPTAEFFDDSVLHDLKLWINSRDWETLKTNFLSNAYYPADLQWNDDDGAERRDQVARQRQPERLQARPARGHRSLRVDAEVSRLEVVRAA